MHFCTASSSEKLDPPFQYRSYLYPLLERVKLDKYLKKSHGSELLSVNCDLFTSNDYADDDD